MSGTVGSVQQAGRMQAAIQPVLAAGPGFLAGSTDADAMAHTMVQAVQGFVDGERARQHSGTPDEEPAPAATRSPDELQAVLAELYTCGSGYLAARCDAACVARTMTQVMAEFADAPSGDR